MNGKLFNIKDYIYYPGEYKMKKFYEDEEYIKMCKSASQNLPTVAPTIGLADGELFYYEYNHTLYKMDGWLFPLYRQDQLQEMVRKKKEDIWLFHERFINDFLVGPFSHNKIYFDCKRLDEQTYEEIWLRIVMKEKHYKTWNGEEWIKLEKFTEPEE